MVIATFMCEIVGTLCLLITSCELHYSRTVVNIILQICLLNSQDKWMT